MEEVWKSLECVGAIGYEISNTGKIRNKRTKRLKKYGETYNGYYRVALYIPDEKRDMKFQVARLVALAFIPNPDNKPEVDHIDCDKHNNVVSNLRWVTHSENMLNPLTRKCLSEMNKDKPLSDEHKQNISISLTGLSHPHTEEQNRKIGEANKQTWANKSEEEKEECRKKVSDWMTGKHIEVVNGKRTWV